MLVLTALLLHSIQGLSRLAFGALTGALLGLPTLARTPTAPPSPVEMEPAVAQEASVKTPVPAPFVFEPGASVPGLHIPRQERLQYDAYLDLGILRTHVGTVDQTCSVVEQPASILMVRPSAPAGETASILLKASGSYFLYEFESTLETKMYPQDWPRLSYQAVTKSSQTRRREVLLGRKNGVMTSSYRNDTSRGAPEGTRIWREAKERTVPEGTLDMLTAVLQARTLIRLGTETLTFPLLDKDRLWQLRLRRGEERVIETREGVFFDAVEVVLEPEPYPDEEMGKSAARFEGVFGINGTIHLWVDKRTGIAIRIQGDLPVADAITLTIDVVLRSYSGTPPEFEPVQPPDKR